MIRASVQLCESALDRVTFPHTHVWLVLCVCMHGNGHLRASVRASGAVNGQTRKQLHPQHQQLVQMLVK